MAQDTGRGPQHQALLPLIQMRQQTERIHQPRLDPLRHTRTLPANSPAKPMSY
nr:hypothetical protein OG781_01815 [Streptomyces sp. NBC_00830]